MDTEAEAPHAVKNPPRRVHRLPDSLIDQIAAGEVVERPASVVKELVENALDAGAGRIRVEVREGGTRLIAVSDDGHGMPQGDALLALERHATSKIGGPEDLAGIRSFGFRGEALPAIASVSRMRLFTREANAHEGFELRVDGGQVVSQRAVGGPSGTRVEVADLFASVPARRKFLKKPSTEWGHIKDWLGRLALALPGVHFEIQADDRAPLVWPATSDPLTRIAAVLSEDVTATLVPVSWEGPEGHIEAYISSPEHTRTNANGLYLFVNGRPVRDPTLRHALLDAYRDLLPRGRFPTAVAFVTVPPESLDVNVHPAKWEVRFADPRAVHRLVRNCVREGMTARSWLDPQGRAPVGSDLLPASERPSSSTVSGADDDWTFARASPAQAALGAYDRVAEGPAAAANVSERISFGSLRIVGQLLASYLVVETKQGLLLVDQHAAHERVLYEQLRAEWLEQGVACQPLLMPETVEIEALALAALLEAEDRAARLGFEIEAFGEEAVIVRGVPALLAGRNPSELVRGLARELENPDLEGDRLASDTRLLRAADRVFATLACHSARRFGDRLEAEEQHAILAGLDRIPWAPTCPHGRPVAISLDLVEIERRFGRR
ncbi:MAG: DNA mismatch repair endonuclease MutL [Myxococcota bacterium]